MTPLGDVSKTRYHKMAKPYTAETNSVQLPKVHHSAKVVWTAILPKEALAHRD